MRKTEFSLLTGKGAMKMISSSIVKGIISNSRLSQLKCYSAFEQGQKKEFPSSARSKWSTTILCKSESDLMMEW